MRRKRIRTIYWVLISASLLMAIFGPRLGSLQATTALGFVIISHPANRLSNWLAFTDDQPVDPVSPAAPRELGEIARENERLRQKLAEYQASLARLQQIHQDRMSLGAEVLERCSPLTVIGVDGDVLQVVNAGRAKLEVDWPVLHYGRGIKGIAGVVSAVGASGAHVRLITDPAVRVQAVFARYDPDREEWITLSSEPPLVEGAGNGMCQVARAARQDLDGATLQVGDWALLADPEWPDELGHFRLGQVAAIEDIPDEPGFSRVMIRPAAELHRLEEVMVFRKDQGLD